LQKKLAKYFRLKIIKRCFMLIYLLLPSGIDFYINRDFFVDVSYHILLLKIFLLFGILKSYGFICKNAILVYKLHIHICSNDYLN